MNRRNTVNFFAVILAIGILTYVTIYGIPALNIPSVELARTGTDIRGGVRATLSAPEGITPTADQMDTVKSIIEKRLYSKNIYDASVILEKSFGRVIVEMPWKQGEKDFNPQKAIDEIGKTALLTFQEVDEDKKDAEGKYLPTGKIIIQGTEVLDAKPAIDPNTGRMDVSLTLTGDAGKKFEEATGRLVKKPIAIFMDSTLISSPVVNERIPAGNGARITLGNANREQSNTEARDLASSIRSGALPFKLEAKEVNSMSPLLGENALRVTVKAGLTALILVCLFMLLYYRLPGIFANIALIGHTAIQLLLITWSGITLTLPGIAGIILTIGMGVDANVIIFERIKEELRNGRTLSASIDIGFKKAFTAIFDANMTTLISAVVLYSFGSGPIQSFAITLGLGVVLSFLTAVTASRIMLKCVSNVNIAKHRWLYGA